MQEWIHVIVLGFSPAVVVDEDIRSEFRYKFVGTFICLCSKGLFFSFSEFGWRVDIFGLFPDLMCSICYRRVVRVHMLAELASDML